MVDLDSWLSILRTARILPYLDIIFFAPSESTVAPRGPSSGKACRTNQLRRLTPDCGAIAHPSVNTRHQCVQRNIFA
jgi:hypothetical protein